MDEREDGITGELLGVMAIVTDQHSTPMLSCQYYCLMVLIRNEKALGAAQEVESPPSLDGGHDVSCPYMNGARHRFG